MDKDMFHEQDEKNRLDIFPLYGTGIAYKS